MDSGAWWAMVHWVTKSRTRLSTCVRMHSSYYITEILYYDAEKKVLRISVHDFSPHSYSEALNLYH